MNWMGALAKTYDKCFGKPEFASDKPPLIPICHTFNNAQIEVTLGPNGDFIGAEVVSEGDQITVIPCSEESDGRTSGLAPHPLSDKLQYLVKEYGSIVPSEEIKNRKAPESGYELYIKQLKEWVDSEYRNEKVVSVYKYMESGRLFNDLVKSGVLTTDEGGRVLGKGSSKESPLVRESKFTESQSKASVRWKVQTKGETGENTWEDEEIQKSWIDYYLPTLKDRGLCYVSGKEDATLAHIHPKKIRNSGDKAKLISSNNEREFTFRGRFSTQEQACGIGLETSHKAHNALRWLIGRQGYREGDLCILTWTMSGDNVNSTISPTDNFYDPFSIEEDHVSTGMEISRQLNNKIRGYYGTIDKNVMMIAMNSATTGRLSILMYREMLPDEFIRMVCKWHESCAWIHRYVKNENKDGKKKVFVGAPIPKDIAEAAYGSKADKKIIVGAIQRILPCIIGGGRIPQDIVNSIIRRASSPVSFEPWNTRKWEWQKTLSIACSVYKQYSGGEYGMTLDEERKTRDYLYGRLLAVADLLESEALKKAGETGRQTTAMRMMQRFSEYPFSTWRNIELALIPYKARLGPQSKRYAIKISKITDMFDTEDFTKDTKLSGEFLLAFHSEQEKHWKKKGEGTIADRDDGEQSQYDEENRGEE